MNRKCVAVLALGFLFGLASAATAQQRPPPSAIACDNFARNYGASASRQGQVIRGAGAGSLLGLGLGALAGKSGAGAAIGATVGAIGGGARRQATAGTMYNAAYQDCMAGRI